MWRYGVLAGVFVAGLGAGVAHADPVVRLGTTFGIDRNAPEAHEVGPLVGLGLSAGRFVGEVNYAYLSFFDPDTSIHRLGVSLRGELTHHLYPRGGSRALYAELGFAERFGTWRIDDTRFRSETGPLPELSIGFGVEFGQFHDPRLAGCQIGVRLGLARRDPQLGTACRGLSCAVDVPASTGVATSAMLEWMYLIGR